MAKISEDFVNLAIMAHDIKAPLSAVINLLSVIDKGYVEDPNKMKELVSRAKKKSELIIRMIEDILDYTELSDKSKMKREKIEIHPIIEESILLMKPHADQKGIQLSYSQQCPHKKLVYGNYTFLLRVFNNLIMNAIKYNNKNGEVSITCLKTRANKLRITIKDTGIGIPSSELQNVFKIFERGKEARNRIDGSIGLGLSLVKQIIRVHEGSIKISSVQGIGTTVSLLFPLINRR